MQVVLRNGYKEISSRIIIIIFWPRYSIPREWKNTLCNTKNNQAEINLTPPPSQNSHAVRGHCTAESKSWFLSRRSTDQQQQQQQQE